MNVDCGHFENLLNEQIDACGAGPPGLAEGLETHAAVCPECRAIAQRYRVLTQAIGAWSALPAPAPTASVASRVLAEMSVHSGASRRPARWDVYQFGRPLATAAAAAVLLLSVWVGIGVRPVAPGRPAPPPPRVVQRPLAPVDTEGLSLALAEATAATLDLARAASGPAARVGREVLDEAAAAQAESTTSLSLNPESIPPSEVLQDVGERINDSVSPLSGTARSAFGFLFGANGG